MIVMDHKLTRINEECIVRKLLVLPALLVLIAAATSAQAQTGPGCGGTAQTYQRFSYQPTPSVIPGNPVTGNGNVATGSVAVAPQTWGAPYNGPQVYRRYSYVPQSYYGATSGHKKNLWEYAKGDSRRYRP